MSILIKGMEMPQNGRVTLQIDSNGGVYVVNKFSITSEKYEKSMPATEIRPHGRLIDADKLNDRLVLHGNSPEQAQLYANICEWIDLQETVIEAEGSETDA